jgi:hypothetical protein
MCSAPTCMSCDECSIDSPHRAVIPRDTPEYLCPWFQFFWASNFYCMTIAAEPSSPSGPPSETRVTATAAVASAAVAVANDNDHPRDGHDIDDHTRHAPSNAAAASAATTADAAAAAADNEDDDNDDVRIHLIEVQRRQTPTNLRPKIHTRNIKSQITSGSHNDRQRLLAAIVACERLTKNVNPRCGALRNVCSWSASHRGRLSLSLGRGGLIKGRRAERRRRPRSPRPDYCDSSSMTCPVCTCDRDRNGDSHSNDNDAKANAKNSATTTATRTTRPGCASRWWRWRRCQWWERGARWQR